MKKFNILPYVFVFLITYLVLQWFQGSNAPDPILNAGEVGLKTMNDEYTVGSDIRLQIQNNGETTLVLPSRCPEALVDVYVFTSEDYQKVEDVTEGRDCSKSEGLSIEPKAKMTLSLLDYSYSLFGTPGKYKISLDIPNTNETSPESSTVYSTPEFDIKAPGIIKSTWRHFIYIPLLNGLIGIVNAIPGHYLAWAIILLTLAIRTILLIPSQRAMQAQKRLQEVQPKIEELKKKYANDQARLAQETMLLWKEQKVSPFSSCLPLLIQFPILIALYYTVNGGLSPDRHVLLYPFLSDFSLSEVNPHFLGLNLFEKSIIILPIIVGGLQFLQMQLMTANASKKSSDKKMPDEIQTANKMMKYIMPVMIAVFTAQLPAAVGLYWAVSTCYGVVQQLVVNKGGFGGGSPEEEIKVRVINRHQ